MCKGKRQHKTRLATNRNTKIRVVHSNSNNKNYKQ